MENKDLDVLTNLAQLIGMRIEFDFHKTTHVILNSERKNEMDKSSKINQLIRVFDPNNKLRDSSLVKPKVVLFEWFLECLLNGKEQ